MSTSDRYFAMEPGAPGVARQAGRYLEIERDVPAVSFLPGLDFRPVLGEGSMVSFVRYAPHAEAPVHAHEEAQITFVLEGEFEFDLDGDVRLMRPGSAVVIPPYVPHGARTHDTGCLEADVFTPPRRVLLEAMREREAAGGEA